MAWRSAGRKPLTVVGRMPPYGELFPRHCLCQVVLAPELCRCHQMGGQSTTPWTPNNLWKVSLSHAWECLPYSKGQNATIQRAKEKTGAMSLILCQVASTPELCRHHQTRGWSTTIQGTSNILWRNPKDCIKPGGEWLTWSIEPTTLDLCAFIRPRRSRMLWKEARGQHLTCQCTQRGRRASKQGN